MLLNLIHINTMHLNLRHTELPSLIRTNLMLLVLSMLRAINQMHLTFNIFKHNNYKFCNPKDINKISNQWQIPSPDYMLYMIIHP